MADGSFLQLLAKTALPALPPPLLEAALQVWGGVGEGREKV